MTIDWRRNSVQVAGTAVIGLSAGFTAVLFHQAMIGLAHWLVRLPSAWPWWRAVRAFRLGMHDRRRIHYRIHDQNLGARCAGQWHPQVKVAYHTGELNFTWRLNLRKNSSVARFPSAPGSSLGREGPTIHIGAALAKQDRQGPA